MDRLSAAIIFFTRLPLWKLTSPPARAFSRIVPLWPLTGWITGGLTALALTGLSRLLPWPQAIVLALSARLLLTGALHEDGLADFFDGFGGGRDKDRILAIMKDSHIGTYGVIALILYFSLLASSLWSMGVPAAAMAILAADPLSKGMAAQITNILPYARPEGAKNGIAYARMTPAMVAVSLAAAIIPAGAATAVLGWPVTAAAACPLITLAIVLTLMWRKIGGYTGDCCGAAALLCELTMLLVLSALMH